MTKTNVQLTPSNSQRHDTPNNKTHVIKFRVTAEEKTSLELTCKLLNLSLSTFIRRAIHNVKIEKTVIVAGGGEETLTAVSTLLAQCNKVGGNLNQLARHFMHISLFQQYAPESYCVLQDTHQMYCEAEPCGMQPVYSEWYHRNL